MSNVKNADVIVKTDSNKDLKEVTPKVKDKKVDVVAKESVNPNLQDSENKAIAPFVRKTRLKKSSTNRTVKSLYKDWKKGLLRFDLTIQRNDVWTNYQRSKLIHTLLYGYPVPPVYVQASEDKNDDNIWFLDGRQRVGHTIMTFRNGDWALAKDTPDVFGHKIAGCKYMDLPEDMRDVIDDETIQIIKMENMTDEERDEMFVRLNSGSSLSKIELTRAMHSELIETINHISSLDFFARDIAMTKKARDRFVDQEIILQISMLIEEGVEKLKGFGSSHIKDFVLRLKESQQVLSDELVVKFEETSKYLSQAVDDFDGSELKKSLKKIHVPIIFQVAQKAIAIKMPAPRFGDFIRSFLVTNYSVESDYGASCQAGSSKKDNVIIRLHEMNKAFDKFVEMLKNANNTFKAVEEFDKELAEINNVNNKENEINEGNEDDEDTENEDE
ncbi:hypothetical protein SUNDANCE_158 [Brevibacillus phage Sundance]|uniref:hypothetical protein n=1 Tax=Brevibacillus phage Sundance TaxID=1691958 RepID=UPI0006BCC0B8|nr:hypothetical protein AVT09_gp158 [Brevibacillus phage Sundance]ALA47974.1 hypothetical protein SUNDANCE_158 [Brevibacillus phage Sundance]